MYRILVARHVDSSIRGQSEPRPSIEQSKVNEVNKTQGMAADGGDVSGTRVAVVDYITIGNVSRWPSVLGVQEEKNGRRFSSPHTERVWSRESRVRFGGWGRVGEAVTRIIGTPNLGNQVSQ